MADTFSSHAESLTSPPSHLVAVTPDDGQDLPAVSRALNVAASGAVQITTAGGDTVSVTVCLLYTSPSPRDRQKSRMPSSA